MAELNPDNPCDRDPNADEVITYIKKRIPKEYQIEYSQRLDSAIADAPSEERDLAYVLDSLFVNSLARIRPDNDSPNPYIAGYMDFALYHLQNTKMEQDSTGGALKAAGTLSHICHFLINKYHGIPSTLGESPEYGKVAEEILEFYNANRDETPDLIKMGNFLFGYYITLIFRRNELQMEGIRKSPMRRVKDAVWPIGRKSNPYKPALVREIWETAKAEYGR